MLEKPQTVHPGGPPSAEKQRSSVRLVVRIVLLAMLGLALAALGYDRLLARPWNEADYEKIQKLVHTKNTNPASKPITKDDVRKTIGRDPSRTVEEDHYVVEYYTWPRGAPFKEYYIAVIYTPKDRMLLHEVTLNEPPNPALLPGGRMIPTGDYSTGQPAGAPLEMSISTEEAGAGAEEQRPEAEQPGDAPSSDKAEEAQNP